jgi:topoisomerase-4 subunit A
VRLGASSLAEIEVLEGLQPFRSELQRDVTHDDVESLLAIPIRRISLFDLEKNRKEIEKLKAELEEVGHRCAAEVEDAVAFAEQSPWPRAQTVTEGVYAD